ncbi:protein NPAT [Megalops cyprinoides]|uniref:protein NPAT n=1 Tax=Megalops cyprinoides TaxID=118141 RepID=UPI001863DB50|nr:protein NPAT [Megalops cyprinoides]
MTSPPGKHHVTVNKENQLEGRSWRERVMVTPTQPGDSPVSSSVQKASCKTSPLTKLAAKILQVGRCPTSASPETLLLPRTPESGRPPEERLDCQESPVLNGEATPRQPSQTTTPDVPACSPASEAGSESSVSMAARTLIILSRATQLRDGSQQRAPHTKATKRKHTQPLTTPAARKQLQLSASMRKAKKRKQQLDSLPNDLDVDKFLSSLHYDE